jgi:hypothetical protein
VGYAVSEDFQTFPGMNIDRFQNTVVMQRAAQVKKILIISGSGGRSQQGGIPGRKNVPYSNAFIV